MVRTGLVDVAGSSELLLTVTVGIISDLESVCEPVASEDGELV